MEPSPPHTATRCEVLVVGAGPTGLTLAAALAKLGVQARIVDKNAARTQYSQAVGVQAGTLEALGQFFGDELPRQMVAAGCPARGGQLHFAGREPVQVDFSQIPSIYNFILILAQSETERLLEEHVNRGGVRVERQTELERARDRGTSAHCTLRRADGSSEEISADYVVGCDGAHSTVRHEASIGFAGGTYTGDFLLGDVVVRWPYDYEQAHVFISEHGILAGLPMRGPTGFYRLILVMPEAESPPVDQAGISLDQLQRAVDPLAPVPIHLSDPVWMARFRLHHRMAERFQSGRLFLAGDAGHIHSPVGAQGMNTGIQDALSLASKLAAVLRGGAPVGVLADYERERYPVARSIVRSTDLAFRIASNSNNGLVAWLRGALAPHVIGARFVQKFLARSVSQVDTARRDIQRRERLAAQVASRQF